MCSEWARLSYYPLLVAAAADMEGAAGWLQHTHPSTAWLGFPFNLISCPALIFCTQPHPAIATIARRYLIFSNWLRGDIAQYDISDVKNGGAAKFVSRVWVGGAIHKGTSIKVRGGGGGGCLWMGSGFEVPGL